MTITRVTGLTRWVAALTLTLAPALACGGTVAAVAPVPAPAAPAGAATAQVDWIHAHRRAGDFALSDGRRSASIVYSGSDAKVAEIAARDLAADIGRVTGRPARVGTALPGDGPAVLVGTLGRSPLIDALAASGKLDTTQLTGVWESFIITAVGGQLVVAGSDPRGTAFGVYELSQAIGVSPWHWWADVAPAHRDALYVGAGVRRFGPPSVKYRGIFINDEDWGLQPWAAKTFEPENGGIGPKTYGKVFELLLRLKANLVWPAMHAVTRPFNADPRNAALADDYAIIMGSSHAEPMLRNNVGEWKSPPAGYNYVDNRSGVLDYWEQRVAANGRYDNVYTLGMRGIHDSTMQGPKTDAERIKVLEQVFADQRGLLARYVRPDVEQVPQMFCAYKEVLPLYRQGLKVPDDVTIVWPDDNFGYIRGYASAAERQRAGGFGVYYHLSYLGAPLSYLWLYTTPPALVWEEMSKAYDAGAQTIWIANVGDLKPAEAGIELFLQMGWDIKRWGRDSQAAYLKSWAAREFGAAYATEIAAIMDGYYRLNYQRKPEHLQWWLPKETPHASGMPAAEVARRLADFDALRARADRIASRLPAAARDAYFELVRYPVAASALANRRYFEGERGNTALALAADRDLALLTAHWDTGLAGGKWRHLMAMEPADDDWRSMRIARWTPPIYKSPASPASPATPGILSAPAAVPAQQGIVLEAERFSGKRDGATASWQVVDGLGRSGDGSVGMYPTTAASIAPERLAADAPRLDYALPELAPGDYALRVNLVPTHPISGTALRFAVGIDDQAPRLVVLEDKDGGADWARGVLDATRVASTSISIDMPGKHLLRVYGVDAGVLLDRLVLDRLTVPAR